MKRRKQWTGRLCFCFFLLVDRGFNLEVQHAVTRLVESALTVFCRSLRRVMPKKQHALSSKSFHVWRGYRASTLEIKNMKSIDCPPAIAKVAVRAKSDGLETQIAKQSPCRRDPRVRTTHARLRRASAQLTKAKYERFYRTQCFVGGIPEDA